MMRRRGGAILLSGRMGAEGFGVGEMREILWTVTLIAVVLLSVSLFSYYWLHWLAR
jgi:hypothetical protein